MISIKNNYIKLDTQNTSYIMHVSKTGHLLNLYYGRKIEIVNDDISFLDEKVVYPHGTTPFYNDEIAKGFTLDGVNQEYPTAGKGDYRESSLVIETKLGYVTDFKYDSARVEEEVLLQDLPSCVNQKENLVITLKDEVLNLKLELIYGIYEDKDVITRSVRLINEDKETVYINKIASFNLDLSSDEFELINFNGAWILETHQSNKKLLPGIYVNDSKTGNSSHRHNPFFMLQEKNGTLNSGSAYGFNLVYSGNHQELVEVTTFHKTRIQSGINPFCFRYEIKENEIFETPVAVLTYSNKGLNGVSQNMHKFVNNHIVRGEWANKDRPVLLNNWEGTYFEFNEAKIVSLAKKAKDVGVELFVLDDGWFGARNDDTKGLGDWVVNKKKLPHDLCGLADKINKMGLKFGLWFEPEMVNEDSDLYRAHPDWAIKVPNRVPTPSRNQLVLDLTKVEVQDYIIEAVSKILSNANIEYVKWDMNRNISDFYSERYNQGEFFHRYILGLYRVLKELTSKFPYILFESCASGGNRFDLGMLCFMPQTWTSDDTDAYERMWIQSGTASGYPLSSMGCHVSAAPSHQLLRKTPLDTRFNVAMFGVLGYELDLGKMSKVELDSVEKQIEFYKKHRHILQFGTFYQLQNFAKDDKTIWMVLSDDRKEGLIGYYQGISVANPKVDMLKTVDVFEDGIYHVENRPQKIDIKTFGDLLNRVLPVNVNTEGNLVNGISHIYAMKTECEAYDVTGAALNAGAIRLKPQWQGTGWDEQSVRLLGDFGSRVYHFKMKED